MAGVGGLGHLILLRTIFPVTLENSIIGGMTKSDGMDSKARR
jgi:hypothetical protein